MQDTFRYKWVSDNSPKRRCILPQHPITKPATVDYFTVPRRLWRLIKKHLPAEAAPSPRRAARIGNRAVLNGIWYVLWTGCQWKAVQRTWFGASSSVLHERFQTWQEQGIWDKVFGALVKFYRRERHIQWRWQAVDSRSCAAPRGGSDTGKNPTDRAKLGSKIHILVDQRGAPWPLTSVAPTNTINGRLRLWCSISPSSARVQSSISVLTRVTISPTSVRWSSGKATSRTSNANAGAANRWQTRVRCPAKRSSQPGAGWSSARWAGWPNAAVCAPAGARNRPTGWPSSSSLVPASCATWQFSDRY